MGSGMVDEHECKHEVDLALLQSDTTEIKTDVKTIVECIRGNGKQGLITDVALQKQSIMRLWWIVSAFILPIAFLVIRSFIE